MERRVPANPPKMPEETNATITPTQMLTLEHQYGSYLKASIIPKWSSRNRKKAVQQLQIGFQHVSSHHTMAIEVVCDLSYGVLHHLDPLVLFFIELGDDGVFELAV